MGNTLITGHKHAGFAVDCWEGCWCGGYDLRQIMCEKTNQRKQFYFLANVNVVSRVRGLVWYYPGCSQH